MTKPKEISAKEAGAILTDKGILGVKAIAFGAAPIQGTERRDQANNAYSHVPWFDSDWNFADNIRERIKGSTTHSAILKKKLTYVHGDPIVFSGKDADKAQKWADMVNAEGENFEEVRLRLESDDLSYGNSYVEFIKVAGQIFLNHKDAICTRVAKWPIQKQETDVAPKDFTPGILFSRDWRQFNGNGRFSPVKINNYPKYAPVKGYDGDRCAMHFKEYFAGNYYYGMIDYHSAYYSGWLDIDYNIPKFNNVQFANQFKPSGILVICGQNMTPEQSAKILKDAEKYYSGDGQNGKVMVFTVNDPTLTPKFIQTDSSPDGAFQQLQVTARENIIEAHGWHPSLLMQTTGKLSNTTEMRTALELIFADTIIPKQRKMCAYYDKIFRNVLGFDLDPIRIKNPTVLSLIEKLNPQQILTVNDQRRELGRDPDERFTDPKTGLDLYAYQIPGFANAATLQPQPAKVMT